MTTITILQELKKLNTVYSNYYSNFIIMKWIEEDGGATITLSATYTYENLSSTISWSQQNGDDDIGTKVVGHPDQKTALYNTGKMKWHQDF